MRMRFLVACLALCGHFRVEAQTSCADGLLGLSDSLTIGERNVFVGTVRKTATPLPACALPTLPAFPAPSTTQLVVPWGATVSMDTSFHGNVLVHSGSTLLVKPGAYRIGAFTQEWGSILRVDTAGLGKTSTRPGVQMVVMGAVQWMDGATTIYPGLSDSLAASRIALYVPAGNPVVTGNGTSLRLQLTAPLSPVSFGDRTSLWGRILSRSVVWHNDAVARIAANGVPPTWTTTTTVSIQGPRRFWTNASSVPVNWTINGVVQASQASEALAVEGAHWIKRSSGAAADSVLAMVDRTAPVVQITSPVANSTTNKPKVAVVYTVDGVSKVDSASLVEGSNTIARTATDSAGNTGTASVLVTLDTQAPVLTILSPANNSTTNKSRIAVTYTVDGVSKVDSSSLVEGANTITRSATDAAGNVGSASIVVKLLTKAPVVNILSPLDNSWTNKTKVAVTYTVDGVSKIDTATLVEGTNTITRSATDAAGNVGSASITVKLDTKAPVVAIVSPVNNAWSKLSPVTLTYTVDGVQASELRNLTEGTNVLVVDVADSAGNRGSASVSVRLDTKAPVVVFTSPGEGDTVRTTSVALAWTVDGVAKTETITLPAGPNAITRTWEDSAGNVGSATLHFVVKLSSGGLVAVLNGPATAYSYTHIVFDASESKIPSGSGVRFRLSQLDGSPVHITSRANKYFQVGVREPGTLRLVLTAEDTTGAQSASSDTVAVSVREPANLAEQLEVLDQEQEFADGALSLIVTGVPGDKSGFTSQNLVELAGVASGSSFTSDSILWTNSRGGSGLFVPKSEYWKALEIPLQKGDNFLTLVYRNGSGDLAATRLLYTYEDSAVTKSVLISPDSFPASVNLGHDIVADVQGPDGMTVELVRILSGEQLLTSLRDDGAAGDSISDDGRFTGRFSLTSTPGENQHFRIKATLGDRVWYSQVLWRPTLVAMSETDIQDVKNIEDQAIALYSLIKPSLGRKNAMDSLVGWLGTQPQVSVAGIAPDGYAVCWIHSSGIHAMIPDAPAGTRGARIRTRMLSPFDVEFGNKDDAYIIDTILQKLAIQEPTRWDLNRYLGNQVSFSQFETWEDLSVVAISTHGATFGFDPAEKIRTGHSYSIDPRRGVFLRPFVMMVSGDASWMPPPANQIYPEYIEAGSSWGITSAFLSHRLGQGGKFLFWGGFCRSAASKGAAQNDIWKTLQRKMDQSSAMFGFEDYVEGKFTSRAAEVVFAALAKGKTAKQAYDSVYDYCAKPNSECKIENGQPSDLTGTALVLLGNPDYRLVDSMVVASGRNRSGQIGLSPSKSIQVDTLTPVETEIPATQVVAGGDVSYALTASGKVFAWGSDSVEQLGDGPKTAGTIYQSVPQPVLRRTPPSTVVDTLKRIAWLSSSLTGAVASSEQYGHTLAVDSAGFLYAWGRNMEAQLGTGLYGIPTSRARMISLVGEPVKQAAAGRFHSIALTESGNVLAWGKNTHWQLGRGYINVTLPPELQLCSLCVNPEYVKEAGALFDGTLDDVVYIAASEFSNMAIKANGDVFGWGSNYDLELGIPRSEVPTKVGFATRVDGLSQRGIKQIALGTDHGLAINDSGTIMMAWGKNSSGELGIGVQSDYSPPRRVVWTKVNAKIVQVVAGSGFSAALGSDGQVYVWGRNDEGQLGLGHTRTQTSPTPLPGRFKSISAGNGHLLLLKGL